MRMVYAACKETNIGQTMTCPGCGKEIIKSSYHHTFCDQTCKDRYWNTIDPKKKNRKHPRSHYNKYNVGEKSYAVRLGDADALRRGYPSHADMIDSHLDDDGSWDAHQGHVEPCEWCGMMPQYCRCCDNNY